MTAEQLHDAIGLLPSDLIAEADRKRCAKPKVIYWKRYAAMAACFAVVLSCSLFAVQLFAPKGATESITEAPAAAAPMEQEVAEAPAAEAAPEEAPKEMTGNGGPAEDSARPLPAAPEPEDGVRDINDIIQQRVKTPLKPSTACFSSNAIVTLIHSRTELEEYLTEKDWIFDFTDFPESYDESWFAEHDLLLLAMLDVPSSSDPRITALNENVSIWELCFAYNMTPAEEESTSSAWHFLVEVEKGQIPDADSVTLIFE